LPPSVREGNQGTSRSARQQAAGNPDGIVQDEEPLLDDARTTFIEWVPAEKEIWAPIELTRRSCGPVIRVSAPDLDATGNTCPSARTTLLANCGTPSAMVRSPIQADGPGVTLRGLEAARAPLRRDVLDGC